MRNWIWIGMMMAFLGVHAQNENRYIIFFTDKQGSTGELSSPEAFLSAEALERRERQGIPVAASDLPVSEIYLQHLVDDGFTVISESRWLNAALVAPDGPFDEASLLALPFIRNVVWASFQMLGGRTDASVAASQALFWQTRRDIEYGMASGQIYMLNGQFLHKNGWEGRNMTIAVLDAGFFKTDVLPAFERLRAENRIKATFDFVQYDTELYESSGHGTNVLSTMAGYIDQQYTGTAPGANYILIKTEDVASEQLIEEFNYVLGLEYADQMGADVINTSLGYTRFNYAQMDHEPVDLNGDVAIASRGADIGASKGMIIVNSAGNEGAQEWQYTSIPADGDSVLAVGSVNRFEERSAFSGRGWPEVSAVKPNVMAQGEEVAVINTNNEVVFSNGTSFSSPIVAGLVACLWEAFPQSTAHEIVEAVQQSSSRYLIPDNEMGYGIPDFQAAYALLFSDAAAIDLSEDIEVFPNPFSTNLTLLLPDLPEQLLSVSLVNDIGQELFSRTVTAGNQKTVNLRFEGIGSLQTGLYFLKIKTNGRVHLFKLIKV